MKDSAPKIGIAQLITFHCYLFVVNQIFPVVDLIWGNIYAAWWFTLCDNINSQLFQWPYMVRMGKDGFFFGSSYLDDFPEQFFDFSWWKSGVLGAYYLFFHQAFYIFSHFQIRLCLVRHLHVRELAWHTTFISLFFFLHFVHTGFRDDTQLFLTRLVHFIFRISF